MKRVLIVLAACLLSACVGGTKNVPPAVVFDFGLPAARLVADGTWSRLALEVRSPSWFDSLNVDYRLAYDDPLGVTAAFNRNMLRHLNALVGSDFDIADWRHVAFFNTAASRIEMHLEAVGETVLHWPAGERRFAPGERIHTENSYKWRTADFAGLLEQAGFSRLQYWTDENEWFAVFVAFS